MLMILPQFRMIESMVVELRNLMRLKKIRRDLNNLLKTQKRSLKIRKVKLPHPE